MSSSHSNPFRDPSSTIRIVDPRQQAYSTPSSSQSSQQQQATSYRTPSPSSYSSVNGIPIAPPLVPPKGGYNRSVGVGGALPPVVSQTTAFDMPSSTGILKNSRAEGYNSIQSDNSISTSAAYGSRTAEGMTTSNGTSNAAAGGLTANSAQTARQQVQRALSGNGNVTGSGHKASLSYAAPSNTSTSSPLGPTRTRRSLSSTSIDSPPTNHQNAFPLSQNAALKQPHLVPVGEKLKSRHADVIDKWDGTGVGRGMLHHAGPYDAAAPSRNADPKAPMKAFGDGAGGGGGTNAPQPSRSYSTDKSPMTTPGIDDLVPVLGSTHLASHLHQGNDPHTHKSSHSASKPSRALSQRAQAALRQQPTSPSRSGSGGGDYKNVPMGGSAGIGSLQGQYSTSLPTSGGYMPTSTSGGSAGSGMRDNSGSSADTHGHGGGLGTVEETNMMGGGMRMGESGGGFGEDRRFRERDREQKRRALKAAWGIDEPEPYEQFGYTGGPTTLEPVQLSDHPLPSPNSPSKMRSPGLRLQPSRSGAGTPTEQDGQNTEYFGLKTGNSTGSNGSESPGAGGFRQGGLKRTKSLMHRLKAMRENPNMPPSDAEPRAPSPNGPYNEDTLNIRSPNDDLSPGLVPTANSGPGGRSRRNSWLRRAQQGNPSALPGSPEAQEEILDDTVGSPRGQTHSKTTTTTTTSGSQGRDRTGSASASTGRHRSATTSHSQTVGGGGGGATDEKALPPPPVGQVMPDFANASSWQAEPVDNRRGSGTAGVQRKTSIMKKMKDKIGGR